MARKGSIIEAVNPGAAAIVLPYPPMRSSQLSNWRDIYIEHHHQPAYETPEYYYGWHVVGIHIGCPVKVEFQSERQSFRQKLVRDGDVYLFPARSRQRMRCYNATEFIDVYLAPDLFGRLTSDLIEIERVHFSPHFAIRDPFIQQLGLTLKTELEASDQTGSELLPERLYAESMAQALAIHLLRRYANHTESLNVTGGLSPLLLQQVIEYINAHLVSELNIETIANLIQLSPYHFSRLFKQSTGFSPYQYILHCRINRAKQLLRQPIALAEVAYSVGFVSQSHFHRHFKRIVGITPRQFRNS